MLEYLEGKAVRILLGMCLIYLVFSVLVPFIRSVFYPLPSDTVCFSLGLVNAICSPKVTIQLHGVRGD